ncbi:uncharacterized protein LOC132791754 [Drosophila nasuta]|uniref:Uncharacterized protein LOC117568735 n=1 Tax=Drosophila albomicans TaxID=7291 RepID=A0A6P8YBY3_DROAB|nr:uncharacterized protein LOC117568735 [Drosophila albomicans]XP_060656789.1 uncharacterized protein LOC132791754 [Drosophila nasuta]
MRRSCRPRPSILSRLNCGQCNRVLFFSIGVGLGVLIVRQKDRIKEELQNASSDKKSKPKD